MFKYGKVLERGIIDVICDRCGKSCAIRIERANAKRQIMKREKPVRNFSYVHLIAKFPYGSPKDMQQHEAHICEKCYDELKPILEKWGLKIEISEYPLW